MGKEMEEQVQEILESVKACEKKIEEMTKEENRGKQGRNRANGRTANRGNCGKICRRGNTTGNETRSDK